MPYWSAPNLSDSVWSNTELEICPNAAVEIKTGIIKVKIDFIIFWCLFGGFYWHGY